MIRIDNVSLSYGFRPIFRKLNLEIATGDIVAVMGPNGMGKSTLLRLMAGVLSPYRGYVEVDGVRRRSTVENEIAIRKKVVYMPDEPRVPLELTGREFLHGIGGIYEIEKERLKDHVRRLLRLFHLDDQADEQIEHYSHGQIKKIAICSALVTDAQVYLLDEPFSGGLDPSALLALKAVLRHLGEESKTTIVLATQVPELVEDVANRILVMKEGEVAAFDTLEGLRRHTGEFGKLELVLEKLVNPDTLNSIDEYLKAPKA